jgi:hypothetical protein
MAEGGGTIEIQNSSHVTLMSALYTFHDDLFDTEFSLQYTGAKLTDGTWRVGDDGSIQLGSSDPRLIHNDAHVIQAGSGRLGGGSGLTQLLFNDGILELANGADLELQNDQHGVPPSKGVYHADDSLRVSNSGTIRLSDGSVLSGVPIDSTGNIEGTGRIENEVTQTGGTISTTSTITFDSLSIGGLGSPTPVTHFAGGVLAGNIGVTSRLELAAGSSIVLDGTLLYGSTTPTGIGQVDGDVLSRGGTIGSLALRGSLSFLEGTSTINGQLSVDGPTTVSDGKLIIDPFATLTGPGDLVLNNGQLEIAGTLEKRLLVSGDFVVGGFSNESLSLTGADVSAEEPTGFWLMESSGSNSITNGSVHVANQVIVNPGTLVITVGATLESEKELLVNTGAELIINGTYTSQDTAIISGNVAVRPSAQMDTKGVQFGPGSSATIDGGFKSSETVHSAGTVAIETNATVDAALYEALHNSTLTGGGSLGDTPMCIGPGCVAVQTAAGGVMIADETLATNSGVLPTLADFTEAATIAPGDGVGALTMKSLAVQSALILDVEIRDAAGVSGVDYDRLNVLDTVSFVSVHDNPLLVRLQSLDAGDGAGPAANFNMFEDHSWTIVGAGDIEGFSADETLVDATGFLNSLAGDFSVVQQDGNLNLLYTFVPARVGDFNADSQIDAADYVVWRKGFATGTYSQADYNTWRANFGATAAGAAAVAHSPLQSAVPEPTTLAVLLSAILAVVTRRQTVRRNRRVMTAV